MNPTHTTLARGRWQTLTLCEQLGNVGSEVHRCATTVQSNPERSAKALARALELLDLSIDGAGGLRKQELQCAREVLVDMAHGGLQFGSDWTSLQSYFDAFAFVARSSR